MGIIKLMDTGNKIQAEIAVQMLKENGINCYYRENGAGSYMEIVSRFSVFGQEIFINEEDKERAEELIKGLDEDGEQEKWELPHNKKVKKWVLIYIAFILILFAISIAFVILS